MDDQNLIQSAWRKQKCLALDSVQFADGRVAILDVEYGPQWWGDDQSKVRRVLVRNWTTFSAARKKASLVHCMYSTDLAVAGPDFSILAGECSADGAFGFVALTDCSTTLLKWVAFFSGSNPFERIHLFDSYFVAITNLNSEYRFLFDDPTRIEIRMPNVDC